MGVPSGGAVVVNGGGHGGSSHEEFCVARIRHAITNGRQSHDEKVGFGGKLFHEGSPWSVGKSRQ